MPRYWCKRFGSTNFVNYTLIFAIFCINIQFLGDVCISIWLLFQNFRFFSNSWHKHDTASNNCANTSKQKQNATAQVEFLKQLILVCLYLRCVLLFWLFVFSSSNWLPGSYWLLVKWLTTSLVVVQQSLRSEVFLTVSSKVWIFLPQKK